MHTFHPVFMPDKMQERLLAEFDAIYRDPNLSATLREAQQWFSAEVKKLSGCPELPRVAKYVSRGDEQDGGRTENSDFHYDLHVVERMAHYLLVVANNSRSGTIMLDEFPPEVSARAEQLFVVQDEGLVLRQGYTQGIKWEQAQAGQITSIHTRKQLHAAAPQFPGDQKIVITVTAPHPDQGDMPTN